MVNRCGGVAVVKGVQHAGRGWSDRSVAGRVRGRLIGFEEAMFASVRRKDQRR